MNRVLITGSSGFIGRHTVPELVRRGYEVHTATRNSQPTAPGVIAHQADLLQPRESAALIARVRPTHLVHLAWYVEHGRFWTSPLNLEWTAASLLLLRAFVDAGGRRAVFAGTCAECDPSARHLIEEEMPGRPATLYGICKNALRETARQYARESSIELAWGRIFLQFGPGEHPGRLVPSIVGSLLSDQPAVVRSGSHIRNLMHVEDVGRAFAAILDSKLTGIVNVASGEPVSLGDVARTIGELTGRGSLLRIEHAPDAPDNPREQTAEAGKLRSIGFTPKYGLRDGLETVVRDAARALSESVS